MQCLLSFQARLQMTFIGKCFFFFFFFFFFFLSKSLFTVLLPTGRLIGRISFCFN